MDWATRLYYESRLHVVSKFVTLTYANAHLTFDKGTAQLVKSDLQKWFKRVRKAGYTLRYYAVGEYGSSTYRPHYHVILFGDVPDSVIESSWTMGLVHIGTVTQESIMYTLGYLVNAKAAMMTHNRVRPFSLMSRKPGLGACYLTPAMREWHQSDRRNYVMVGGEQRHLPRYFKQKLFSKIDQVRIAVQVDKEWFERELAYSRRPSMLQLSYSEYVAYRREQQRITAERIRAHSKSTQSI